jgi:hypothetical protein
MDAKATGLTVDGEGRQPRTWLEEQCRSYVSATATDHWIDLPHDETRTPCLQEAPFMGQRGESWCVASGGRSGIVLLDRPLDILSVQPLAQPIADGQGRRILLTSPRHGSLGQMDLAG